MAASVIRQGGDDHALAGFDDGGADRPGDRAPRRRDAAPSILLKPAGVFDGMDGQVHRGWQVLVEGDRIAAVGPDLAAPAGAQVIDLPGDTLMPGMIEGHGHLFLHPYNETSWDDQVLHEPLALRTARAVASAKATLLAGFTSERDLGTEGAGYADVGLREAIDKGIVPGPRLQVATRAIVALGRVRAQGLRAGRRDPARRRGSVGRRLHRRRGAPPDRGGRRLDQALRRLPLAPRRGQPRDA